MALFLFFSNLVVSFQRQLRNCKVEQPKVYIANPGINIGIKSPVGIDRNEVRVCVCRQMLLYSQEENGDCVSSEEDLFIL